MKEACETGIKDIRAEDQLSSVRVHARAWFRVDGCPLPLVLSDHLQVTFDLAGHKSNALFTSYLQVS